MLSHAATIRHWSMRKTLCAALACAFLAAGCGTTTPTASYPAARSVDGSEVTAKSAADVALEQIGRPYKYGGSSPAGFDCSGLVHYSYARSGKRVPRTTGDLWRQSAPVAEDALRIGDVLFFNIEGKMSHVGMYLGDGRFVHAPSSGKRVGVASLASPFYRQAFIRGGRP
jgi:cell wall-associated NlpC family hydrolase